MTLRSLEVFLAVAEQGSMRAAAEQMYISQPTVSGVIADLEREFAVRLFERLGRKLYITPEGERLAGYARRMLSLGGEIVRQMGAAESALPLRIGATVTVGTCVIGNLLRRLPELQAQVLVDNTGAIEQMLLRNELDVALVEGGMRSEDLLVSPVMHDEICLICPADHLLAQRASIMLEDLADQKLILREAASGTRQVLDELFRVSQVPMHLSWQCNNTQAILNAVSEGFGVTLLSPRLLPEGTNLRAVQVNHPQMSRWFSLVVHKDKFVSRKLQAFMDICNDT